MEVRQMALIAAIGGLCACGPSQPQRSAPNNAEEAQPANSDKAQPGTADKAEPGSADKVQPGLVANFEVTETAPLPEPVIDPKSSEAAAGLARGFVNLLNRGRFDAAYMLIGPGAPPRGDFDRQFGALTDLAVTMGTSGGQEGAAGSSYMSIPVRVAGRLNGKRVDRPMTLIMRRVNDVPGSTEAQRRWHIERIEAQPS